MVSSESLKSDWSIDDFEIGRPLGKGKFGRVYLARESKQVYSGIESDIQEQIEKYRLQHQLEREMAIQTSLRHPHVLRLYGWFHDAERIFLILEYARGGEHRRSGHHSEEQAATCRLKIAEFGWSVQSANKRHTMCRTLDYLASEMVENKAHDYAVDNWTLGILCYEFLYGAPPFEADSQADMFRRVMKVDLTFPSTPHVSDEAKDVITQLLVEDCKKVLPREDLEASLDHHEC